MSALRSHVLAALLVAAAASATAATVTVQQLAGRQFSPRTVAIHTGDTVEWLNADTMGHTTTSGPEGAHDGRFDSGDMQPGDRFSYTFTAAGTFPYYCDYHGGMTGSVVVVDGPLVTMPGRRFEPASLAVMPGETVTWVNVDTMGHTATSGPEGSPDGLFSSGDMQPGATFSHTFAAAGTYPYHCDYHSGMVGEVVVQDAVTPLLLHLVKSGPDVMLTWSGGSAPYMIHRGEAAALDGGLPVWRMDVLASPALDPGVTRVPPSLYYRVE